MDRSINFAPGDVVSVYEKVREAEKTRIQIFRGVVLAIKGRNGNKSFTVRKMVGDVAVEKIWPLKSPSVEKIIVKSHPKKRVRRAKLYYLRKQK